MNKISIKSVQKFCELEQIIEGKLLLPPESWAYSGKNLDVRFQDSELQVTYHFKGGEDEEGHYISGSWKADIPGVCSRCSEPTDIKLNADYRKVYLKSNSADSLKSEIEIIECWPKNFDLLPWLLSEVIIQVPISPAHTSCVVIEQMNTSLGANKIHLDKDTLYQKLK